MADFVEADLAAMQAAMTRATDNRESQQQGQANIYSSNEGTQANWVSPAGRSFGNRSDMNDEQMTTTGMFHQTHNEAQGSVINNHHAFEADNVAMWNAIHGS